MEKLFDLLKQHCRKRYGFKDNDNIEIDADSVSFHLYLKGERLFPIRVETVICKEFGFIKWLLENKKIDLYKLPIRLEEYYQSTEAVGYITDDETILLMELAIQDEPIEFLTRILKNM